MTKVIRQLNRAERWLRRELSAIWESKKVASFGSDWTDIKEEDVPRLTRLYNAHERVCDALEMLTGERWYKR